MRILLSATPAYGHLLPLGPLSRAAAAGGHEVAVLTSGGASAILDESMPGTELLAAGAMPAVFSADAAERTGADVMMPSPETIGEIFGGSRLDMSLPAAVDVARAWHPDLLLCESFDTVGPFVATALDVDWSLVGIGPEAPRPVRDAVGAIARRRYDAWSMTPRAPRLYVDECPPLLQTPGFVSPAPRRAMRTRPHRREADAWRPPVFADQGRPTVLVTLGTIFSTTELLDAVVRAVASAPVNVVATLGHSIVLSADADDTPDVTDLVAGPNIAYVPFTPLGELLAGVDLVVSAGGSGTVLGALTEGVAMVLWPQGADQPVNAERVRAAGAAIVVGAAAELTAAVAAIVAEASYRETARRVAAEIAEAATPAQIVRELTVVAA